MRCVTHSWRHLFERMLLSDEKGEVCISGFHIFRIRTGWIYWSLYELCFYIGIHSMFGVYEFMCKAKNCRLTIISHSKCVSQRNNRSWRTNIHRWYQQFTQSPVSKHSSNPLTGTDWMDFGQTWLKVPPSYLLNETKTTHKTVIILSMLLLIV